MTLLSDPLNPKDASQCPVHGSRNMIDGACHGTHLVSNIVQHMCKHSNIEQFCVMCKREREHAENNRRR